MPVEQRRTPRVRLDCPITLLRRRGSPITGHTEDVGPGGARVVVERPLAVDEELRFDLVLADNHVAGRARVLRQDGVKDYAVRFEALSPAAAELLSSAAHPSL
jgi:hypothetical protein